MDYTLALGVQPSSVIRDAYLYMAGVSDIRPDLRERIYMLSRIWLKCDTK